MVSSATLDYLLHFCNDKVFALAAIGVVILLALVCFASSQSDPPTCRSVLGSASLDRYLTAKCMSGQNEHPLRYANQPVHLVVHFVLFVLAGVVLYLATSCSRPIRYSLGVLGAVVQVSVALYFQGIGYFWLGVGMAGANAYPTELGCTVDMWSAGGAPERHLLKCQRPATQQMRRIFAALYWTIVLVLFQRLTVFWFRLLIDFCRRKREERRDREDIEHRVFKFELQSRIQKLRSNC